MNKTRILLTSLVVALALSLSLGGLALARTSDHGKVTVVPVSGTTGLPVSGAFLASSVASGQQVGIWVTGTGRVTAKPDIATLSLGVQAEARTVADAQAQAQQAMSAVMASLTANGVADKDIQTSSFSIQPVYNYTTGNQRILEGYQVTNIVTIKIRDLTKTGTIIDAAVAAGGNLTIVNSINFTIEDPTLLNNQARDLAIKDAVAKAQQVAGLTDVKLGKLIYFSETGGYVAPPRVAIGAQEVASTPISPGELDVTVSVQLVYDIQ